MKINKQLFIEKLILIIILVCLVQAIFDHSLIVDIVAGIVFTLLAESYNYLYRRFVSKRPVQKTYTTPLIYLASPYTSPNKWVQEIRYNLISAVGAKLIEDGHHVFGPITESHTYSHLNPKLNGKWDFWKEHDLMMIDRCQELWVICLNGWQQSTGVTAEIEYALQQGIEVKYKFPDNILGDEYYQLTEETSND